MLRTSNGEISIFGSLIDARSFASIGHVRDSRMGDFGALLEELGDFLAFTRDPVLTIFQNDFPFGFENLLILKMRAGLTSFLLLSSSFFPIQ